MRRVAFLFAGAFVACVNSLPGNWTSAGCWLDNTGVRTLGAASYFDPAFNTQEACIIFCQRRNYTLAGVEFGRECYCDSEIRNGATIQAAGDCNIPCPFNTAEECGGSSRLNLFTNGALS